VERAQPAADAEQVPVDDEPHHERDVHDQRADPQERHTLDELAHLGRSTKLTQPEATFLRRL